MQYSVVNYKTVKECMVEFLLRIKKVKNNTTNKTKYERTDKY